VKKDRGRPVAVWMRGYGVTCKRNCRQSVGPFAYGGLL